MCSNTVTFIERILWTVPTIVTAHTFCASRETPMGDAYQYRDISVWFKTMRKKQNSASAFRIQNENCGGGGGGGDHALFRENKASVW